MSMSDRPVVAKRWTVFGALFAAGAVLIYLSDREEGVASKAGTNVVPIKAAASVADGPGLGRPVSSAQLALLDQTVMSDGSGLPEGEGTPAQGKVIFEQHCQVCHGEQGQGGIGAIPALTGGLGSLGSSRPVRSLNSFWPYAPPAFDYIRRAMPPAAPHALSNDEVYAVLGYQLSVDGIMTTDAKMNRETLANIKMPNRNAFEVKEIVSSSRNN